MRAIRCLGVLLAVWNAGAAAEWTALAPDNGIYTAYADAASIRRQGEFVRMEGLYDFRRQDYTPDGRGLYSTVVLREYDCARRQVRLLSAIDFSGHMGEGAAVSASDWPRRWEAVVGGGIDERFLAAACGAK